MSAALGTIAQSWRKQAACAAPEVDPELFFPSKGSPGLRQALDVCERCTVRRECLEFAVSLPVANTYGIWGGQSMAGVKREARQRRTL